MTEFEKTVEKITPGEAAVHTAVLEAVIGSKNKLTPLELENRLSRQLSVRRKVVKKAIQLLVEKRDLAYTYHYGCSFVEKSFNKPTRLSDRVVLKPPGTLFRPASNDIVIDILPGASFGTGEHPTTRLAIQALERVFSINGFLRGQHASLALDIGTGSGILAMAAALLGANRVIGLDIDPCAVAEAKNNVQLNNLELRVEISSRSVETIGRRFALITANLRYPTVKRLSEHIDKLTYTGSVFVVSGLNTTEIQELVRVYSQRQFKPSWEAREHDWACVVLERSA